MSTTSFEDEENFAYTDEDDEEFESWMEENILDDWDEDDEYEWEPEEEE